MARQPRVEYSGYFWVSLEIARDCRGGAALPVDAEFERFEPFEEQPGVKRAERGASVPVEQAEIVLDEFLRGENRAAKTAPLAIDVLGRRINDDVGAEPERPL